MHLLTLSRVIDACKGELPQVETLREAFPADPVARRGIPVEVKPRLAEVGS